MTERNDWIRVIDEKLDHVLNNPHGWGGMDAIEPLVLMLLMLRAEFSTPPSPRADVVRQYRKFLAKQFGPGAGDIRERLGVNSPVETAADMLRIHVADIRARPPAPVQAAQPISTGPSERDRRRSFPRFNRSIEHEAA